MPKVTLNTLMRLKQSGEKITALTAYDASFANMLSSAGIEIILVGDTLGNVIQGQSTTVPVTVEDMVYHTQIVARGNQDALIISDLPFLSYATPEQTLINSTRLMQAGGHMVKLEGGAWLYDSIKSLSTRGIPVCAHLGLTPQSVHAMGGYRIQGKTPEAAKQLFDDASALQDAGARLLVLECVPAALAADISTTLDIPTIGIGAGNGTDGQILVTYDLLGISMGGSPKFAKNFLTDTNSIESAIKNYINAVKEKKFPAESP